VGWQAGWLGLLLLETGREWERGTRCRESGYENQGFL
jgi:hypothetical protein